MAGVVDPAPGRFRHWSVLAFGAWNAVIWLARIRNIVADESLGTGGRALWLVPAVVFGFGGLLAVAAWWRGGVALARPLTAVVAAVVLYWPVRTVLILLDGRSMAFRLVHVVLAAVSVSLAVAVWRRLQQTNLIPTGAYR
jgi:hypothetical protein